MTLREGEGLERLHLGDVVRLKKRHPCGEDRWEILRTGADVRLRCLGCGRSLLIPRRKLEKALKERVATSEDDGAT